MTGIRKLPPQFIEQQTGTTQRAPRQQRAATARSTEYSSEGAMTRRFTSESYLTHITSPRNSDVLMGRGGSINQRAGNLFLRSLAISASDDYRHAPSKAFKSNMCWGILKTMHTDTPRRRFIEKDTITGLYNEVPDERAVGKISQTIRDVKPQGDVAMIAAKPPAVAERLIAQPSRKRNQSSNTENANVELRAIKPTQKKAKAVSSSQSLETVAKSNVDTRHRATLDTADEYRYAPRIKPVDRTRPTKVDDFSQIQGNIDESNPKLWSVDSHEAAHYPGATGDQQSSAHNHPTAYTNLDSYDPHLWAEQLPITSPHYPHYSHQDYSHHDYSHQYYQPYQPYQHRDYQPYPASHGYYQHQAEPDIEFGRFNPVVIKESAPGYHATTYSVHDTMSEPDANNTTSLDDFQPELWQFSQSWLEEEPAAHSHNSQSISSERHTVPTFQDDRKPAAKITPDSGGAGEGRESPDSFSGVKRVAV